MTTCQARRGFLTLRDCGNPSTSTCNTCMRPMCSEHMSSRSGYQTCLECTASGAQPDDKKTSEATENDSEWAYGYRRNYYSTYGYMPFYIGHHHYDDYDVRSFDDDVNAGAVDADDVERGGFGDS